MNSKTNILKSNIQDTGVILAKNNPFYIAEFATGVGKTLLFIKLLEEMGGKWNIVLAETNHKNNWIDEFIKHDKVGLLKNVEFFCYASLHKHLNDENYCFDEVHTLLNTPRRLNFLRDLVDMNLKRFVGLSATLSRTQKSNLNDILPNVFYHKVPISYAIEKEILPEPKVYLIGIDLKATKQIHPFNVTKNKTLYYNSVDWYNAQSNRIDYYKQLYFNSRNEWEKTRWLREGNNRKKFLAELKTPFAAQLLTKLQDKRLICFTYSISQSEILSKGNSIHSKISSELREDMIKDFNEGKIDKLFTTKMLREGMNLNNIEVGVMVQLDNNIRSMSQSLGRVLRSSYPEYYILYVKNTQDEVYLNTVLEEFNKEYVYTLNINDL